MGYARYEIIRPNGDRIWAGYAVETVCEEEGCTAKIDRGLAHLCGKDPRGDEHGCGGYFCERHLYGDNQCTRCSAKADEENRWVHPETGEEFDLRDHFLPAGQRYYPRGTVWGCVGLTDEAPVLVPMDASGRPTGEPGRLILDGEWESAATVMYRQMREDAAKLPH